MKYLVWSLILAALTGSQPIMAQAFLKAEYMSATNFRDVDNNKTGGKGDAKVVQAGFNIPIVAKTDEHDKLISAWGITCGGSYTTMNNDGLAAKINLSSILDAQIGLMHTRPISEKWSLIASVGIGIYTDAGKFSKFSFKDLMGNGGVLFVCHLKENLDLGGGIMLNSTFGYPMVFPAFYLNWMLTGRYTVEISMVNAIEMSCGMRLNKSFNLKLIASMDGMLAFTEQDDKKQMFTQQYIVAGLQPEFVLGKNLTLPVTLGVSPYRTAFYTDRTLKAFFKDTGKDFDPHFSLSPYISAAIKYGF